MDIVIHNSGGVPIYDQITRQMKGLILRGELKEGEALPSMRLLAKELRISVITTKRAYEELEREGFINTVPGKGCFVAPQDPELFVYQREYEGQKLLVACNLSGSTRKLEGLPQENWELVLTNAPVEKDTLLPWPACVFKTF